MIATASLNLGLLLVLGLMVGVACVSSAWAARRWPRGGAAAGAVLGAGLVGLPIGLAGVNVPHILLHVFCVTPALNDIVAGLLIGAGVATAHAAEHRFSRASLGSAR